MHVGEYERIYVCVCFMFYTCIFVDSIYARACIYVCICVYSQRLLDYIGLCFQPGIQTLTSINNIYILFHDIYCKPNDRPAEL